jgi:hypothetical protein
MAQTKGYIPFSTIMKGVNNDMIPNLSSDRVYVLSYKELGRTYENCL